MSRRVALHVSAATAVLLLAIWLSSGTLAPYAATVEHAKAVEPCHYLVNVDHYHFIAIFSMLNGDDIEYWIGSVMLRRLLFHVIALPFVKLWGALAGGLIASMVIHVAALVGFTIFVSRRIGDNAAIAVAWLLATYPGITYWSGLPYSYVVIVPGSIACMILLYRLQEAATIREVVAASALMGVVFLGYDLFAFFGPAAVLILTVRRRVVWAAVASIAMVLLLAFLGLMFVLMGVPVMNSSTGNYAGIFNAYLHPGDIAQWMRYLVQIPAVFISNFFAGNFVILPALFCVAYVVARGRKNRVLQLPDIALLVSAGALFLFNNAAPPYYGWQLRGHWIGRLYQPIFPVFLLVIARVTEEMAAAKWWRVAVATAVVINASVAFGPVLMNPLAAHVYRWFYDHSPAESLLVNLQRFGRRPLGFCSGNHQWDNIPDPNTPLNRPAYIYRYPPASR